MQTPSHPPSHPPTTHAHAHAHAHTHFVKHNDDEDDDIDSLLRHIPSAIHHHKDEDENAPPSTFYSNFSTPPTPASTATKMKANANSYGWPMQYPSHPLHPHGGATHAPAPAQHNPASSYHTSASPLWNGWANSSTPSSASTPSLSSSSVTTPPPSQPNGYYMNGWGGMESAWGSTPSPTPPQPSFGYIGAETSQKLSSSHPSISSSLSSPHPSLSAYSSQPTNNIQQFHYPPHLFSKFVPNPSANNNVE
jgi:hypothetical protein